MDPCVDDPDAHLAFLYDEVAQLASVLYKTDRGRVTRDLFQLNRMRLRRRRSERVRSVACLVRLAPGDAEARALLDEAVLDSAEYAAFARALTKPTAR